VRANDVIHRRTGRDLWNHGPHQEPRDRRVTVGKMRGVGIVLETFARKLRRPDTREANVRERFQSHSRIDRDAHVRRNSLQQSENFGLADVEVALEEFLVADRRKVGLLSIGRDLDQSVLRDFEQPQELGPRSIRKWHLRDGFSCRENGRGEG